MSYLQYLIDDVNKTHKKFGNLVAICQVSIKARKLLLIVSPSGCGKSTAMDLMADHISGILKPDRLSIPGLAGMVEELTSFRSGILIDDITTTGTPYARKSTLAALAALCYTHRVESRMADNPFQIEDFYGSAIVGIQPIFLRHLMIEDEWESSIQDKSLRYYHLQRPVEPNLSLPLVQIERGLDIDQVNDFEADLENPDYQDLLKYGSTQWSRARVKEHVRDMLKAIAALEDREDVIPDDYAMLKTLLKPMTIESIAIRKDQLEGERYLDNNLLALLAEYYSYNGAFSLAHISQDFKVKLNMAYKIMQTQNGHWQQIGKSPTIYRPNKELLEELQELDLDVKTEEKSE